LLTLPEATLKPGDHVPAVSFAELTRGKANQLDVPAILCWLQALLEVLQSAANSADFLDRATQSLVNLVPLDACRALMLDGETWVTKAVSVWPGRDGLSDKSEFPAGGGPSASRHVLNRVRADRRTYWDASAEGEDVVSLREVRAVVAAPILDRQGDVIGVLYGDRFVDSELRSAGPLTVLDAMLVEVVARGVAAGLARLDQEQQALAARVRFEQFFTPELAEQLTQQPDLLQGRDGTITVLFCDVRRFSRISESLEPAQTGAWIADVMGALSECVRAHGGVLVDYYGDGLMAMWGAPEVRPDHALRACQAAVAMLGRLPELNARWHATIREEMKLGIGIHSGRARIGNTGSHVKFKYGAIGATVNLASRVEGATKFLHCRALMTGETHRLLEAMFPTRRLCRVRVVNMANPVDLYELGVSNDAEGRQACREYEKALAEFERQDFEAAARTLGAWRIQRPDDGPALVLLQRVVAALLERSATFDPVWVLPGK
jgi:adenylate cyclase